MSNKNPVSAIKPAGNKVSGPKRPNDGADLSILLEKTEGKLHRTEMLLSVTQKIAGLKNLSEILWTLIEMTTQEMGADRGSLFLNDALTGELYSRVAQGDLTREIRILNTTGIAGAIFQSGMGEIIHDAYSDDRFNQTIFRSGVILKK